MLDPVDVDEEGDVVRCYAGGGGGYVNPLDRDPQAFLADGTSPSTTPGAATG